MKIPIEEAKKRILEPNEFSYTRPSLTGHQVKRNARYQQEDLGLQRSMGAMESLGNQDGIQHGVRDSIVSARQINIGK